MNTRQPAPWAWVLGAIVLAVVAGAVGYWLGGHRAFFVARHAGPGGAVGFDGFGGFGLLGLLLVALLVALAVGLIVAAMTRGPDTAETVEEWHRHAHATDAPPPATPAAAAEAPAARPEDETVT